MKNRAFTLIELLVVVLIIGILAAIAVPQYQKAVMKANLHKGIPIVESLYQAQQAYYLTHGEFATDVDNLDISIPINESCEKVQTNNFSRYVCDFGKIGIGSWLASVMFQDPNNNILYARYLFDVPYQEIILEAGARYCYAKGTNEIALNVCKGIGGELIYYSETGWNYFKIK